MAEIINLRQARKRAARDAASAKAAANRTSFGLPKLVRVAAKAEQAKRAAQHDGRLLDGRASASAEVDAPDDTAAN